MLISTLKNEEEPKEGAPVLEVLKAKLALTLRDRNDLIALNVPEVPKVPKELDLRGDHPR